MLGIYEARLGVEPPTRRANASAPPLRRKNGLLPGRVVAGLLLARLAQWGSPRSLTSRGSFKPISASSISEQTATRTIVARGIKRTLRRRRDVL